MALRLPEDTVDAKDMLQHIIEQNEGHIDLFLTEGLQPGLDEVTKLLTIDWYVVPRQPVREEDRSSESLLLVDGREELERDTANRIIGPLPLLFSNKTILEETQGFVSPDPDETFKGKSLKRLNSFVDTAHPSRKLTRTVDVVGLDLGREALLRLGIELDHGLGKSICVATEGRNNLEDSRVESAINLGERQLARVVDHDKRSVPEEPGAERRTAGVGWRITGADELDAVKRDPRLVRGPPEAIVLHKLAEEGDGPLCAVLVGGGKVDLVAEDDEPAPNLPRRENNSVESLLVLAVLALEKLRPTTSMLGSFRSALKRVIVLPEPGGPQRSRGLCSASQE